MSHIQSYNHTYIHAYIHTYVRTSYVRTYMNHLNVVELLTAPLPTASDQTRDRQT
jgi:hypothetical protein